VLVGVAITDRSTPVRRLLRNAGALLPTLTGLLQLVDRRTAASLAAAHDEEEFADEGVDGRDDSALDELDEDDLDEDEAWEDADDEGSDHDDSATDDGLDARVLAAYDADPLLATLPIEIDAPAPGTITLDGVVPSAKLIAHAVTIARGTPGVERVEHHLTVRRPRRPGA
jgi:hypothetical protein